MGRKSTSLGLVTVGDGRPYLDAGLKFCVMDEEQFESVIWDTVDVILVSNIRSILGLPFICAQTSFCGRILATEPVVKFGKILLEDLTEALEQVSSVKPDIFQLNTTAK
ncbi:unnamed protein product [Echinostoma caproni]|uniref:RL10P_insert domain-containing protein n=1 Tax=Echinostoma caproni TaxID=27848 RepID=A0A183BFM7_9TREM|nr:unnamed protein product [Echinostoma caproni]